MIKNDHISSQ